MSIPTPRELLQKQLDDVKRALKKSKLEYKDGLIDLKTHTTHVENNEPIIAEYIQALRILHFYMD